MDWSLFRFVNVVDLTQPLFEGMPVFPGDPEVSRTPLPESPEYPGVRGMVLSFSDHTGTHLDAPAHLLEDGLTVDRIASVRSERVASRISSSCTRRRSCVVNSP